MKKALFQEKIEERPGAVRCGLCSHRCVVQEGKRGLCGVRANQGGELMSLVYGRLVSENVDPVEKKPLFHLLPGSLSYSIATVGCNFRCLHCQNYQISQVRLPAAGAQAPGRERSPAEVVDAALATGCRSISYTYIEPTVFYEFALDTARLARQQGLRNIFVSNGYTSPEATRLLAPVLDANNIDLKSYSDRFYKEVCGARLQPVLDTIRLMKELGVWVEVTTLVIPGWNDSDEELRDIARFIKSVDPAMPWHVSRFYPTYKMTDRGGTPVATVLRAREIGLAEGLHYVYVGNIPGEQGENTLCPACGALLIERFGYQVRGSRLENGHCTGCGHKVPGIWDELGRAGEDSA